MSTREKVNILLVDDEPANLLALEAVLGELGEALVRAATGEDAVRLAAEADFAAVLLDVRMPGLSGFETAKLLRTAERSQITPIIFLTAGDPDDFSVRDAYALGAVDYLMKPLVPEILRAKVAVFVDLFRLRQADRAKAEAALRNRDQRLELLVDHAVDYAFVILDAEGRIVEWPAGAERLMGWTVEEALGQHASLMFTPEDRAASIPEFEMRTATRDGTTDDKRWHLKKDGTRFYGDGVMTALRGDDGALLGFGKVLRDVTEQHLSQQALRRSDERVRLAATAGGVGYWTWDLATGRALLDPTSARLFGVGEEAAADEVLDRIDPADRERVQEAVRVAWDGKAPYDAEFRVNRPDGTTVWVTGRGDVVRDVAGRPAVLTGVSLDVTERKRAEEALRESEERLQLAVGIARMGTFDIDLLTDAVTVNEPGRAIYGWDGVHTTFAQVQAHFHPADRDEVMGRVSAAFDPAGPGTFEVEQRIHRTDGAVRWIRVRGRAFFAGEGDARRAVRCLGTYLDITERRQAEESLKEADRRKDEFLAMLGHELRNPLAPLKNALAILRQPAVTGRQIESVRDIMSRQVEQLSRLVDDLLDVSRITTGKAVLKKEPVELLSVVARAVETSRPLVELRRHALTVDAAPLPVWLNADPVRLAQVVSNLLINAAKYTDEGGHIWLSGGREGDDAVVRVKDSGIGLTADMLPKVFDMFTQVEPTLARSGGGLGLGLTLVKRLVELHGGTVEARSEGLGKGSEFVVRLPAGKSPGVKSQNGSRSGPGAHPRRVLVVDDNVDSAESMAVYLQILGHEVRTAHDGRKALDAVRAFRPELVLLDIGLPGVDGYEVARLVRREFPPGKLVLAAMTGYGRDEDRKLSTEAGFDRHLVKPVPLDAVQELLNTLPVNRRREDAKGHGCRAANG